MGVAVRALIGILFWPLGAWWLTGTLTKWGRGRRALASVAAFIVGFAVLLIITPSQPKPADTTAAATSLPATAVATAVQVAREPTAPSTPAPTPVRQVASLGEPRESWVGVRGAPTRGIIGDLFGDTEVAWSADGRARHIELLIRPDATVADARVRAQPLHPSDATSVRTYRAPAGQTVEVFRSAKLAASFPSSSFGEEPPGTYIQIAERGSPRTGRVLLALGNNP